ncbi:MAG: DUF1624 domain-containing protein [Clostridiales bacterium]|jgi:uncharacterized membrane protein|nr:DUF1624 domain-containing protein [Clostridiales bacterium]
MKKEKTADISKKARKIKPTYRERVWELDFIRGVCLILMMLYHLGISADFFMYIWEDFVLPENFAYRLADFITETATSSLVENYIHNFVIIVFFTVAGLSVSFSRNLYKSFIKTAVFAAALTGLTVAASYVLGDESFVITHGVFHIFAICYLLNIVFNLTVKDKALRSGLLLSFGIFIIILAGRADIKWPDGFLGELLVEKDYSSSPLDNFMVLPYAGWFLVGAAVSPFLYPAKKSLLPKLNGKWHLPVTFPGRHPVAFYALQIVFVILFMFVIGLIFVPAEWLTALFG